MKGLISAVFVSSLVLGMGNFSLAMMCSEYMQLAQAETSQDGAVEKEAVEVGNKICPVSGEKIDTSSEMEPAQLEYEGKIYNFCCPGCIEMFKKDPKKYIEKIEEMQEEGDSEEHQESGAGEHKGHDHHH